MDELELMMDEYTSAQGLANSNPREVLLAMRERHGSIGKTAKHLEVNKGLVSAALNRDYFPPKLRRAMGLPESVTVVPCTTCGDVHTHDCHTHRTVKNGKQVKDKRRASWFTPDEAALLDRVLTAAGRKQVLLDEAKWRLYRWTHI